MGKIDSIARYPLLKSIGQPAKGEVTTVKNWSEVEKYIKQDIWETCQLMARNALYDAVQVKDWDRAHEWNDLTREVKPTIALMVKEALNNINPPV